MLAADLTSIYVASIAPLLMFMGAVVVQYLQNRNLKRENERLSSKDNNAATREEYTNLLRFSEGLQKQVDTNYRAYQDAERGRHDAEQGRQAVYKQLLESQQQLFEARQLYFQTKNGEASK